MRKYRPLKKRGVKAGTVLINWTEAEELQLVDLWEQGLTMSEIADEFIGTRTFEAIKNRLCRLRGRRLIW